MYKIIHWLGVIAIAVLTTIFVFKPHLLGLTENPEIASTREQIMVDRDGFPLNDWTHLEKKYGCKFWINQSKLMSFIERPIFSYRDLYSESEEFLAKYAEEKRKIEVKLKEVEDRINGEEKISIPKLKRSNLAAELRKLEREKIDHQEIVSIYKEKIVEEEEKSKSAAAILTAIRSRYPHCFDDKSTPQIK